MLLTSIVAYLILTIFVGFWASRNVRTSGDFMLAGRSLPLLLGSTALFATWFGSETVFGASSQFLDGGLYNVIEEAGPISALELALEAMIPVSLAMRWLASQTQSGYVVRDVVSGRYRTWCILPEPDRGADA